MFTSGATVVETIWYGYTRQIQVSWGHIIKLYMTYLDEKQISPIVGKEGSWDRFPVYPRALTVAEARERSLRIRGCQNPFISVPRFKYRANVR